MKGRHIKILTIFGLIAIIALQTIWLCNAYIQFSQSIYKDSNDILKKSLNREASIRFEKTPKGTMINGAPIKDSNEIVPEIAYLNEGLLKLGLELSLTNVDSLANDFLKATNIESTITIYLLNTDTEKVLNKSKNDLDIHSFGIIKTDIIPIRTDLSQGVQMILINPYYTIIKRMGLLLIATVILMIFVIGCIVYQIKIIARQNKIARLLQKELSDIFLLQTKSMPGILISVSAVRISSDMSVARAYLSIFPSEKSEKIVKNINGNMKSIRFELGTRVRHQLRIIPELKFFVDDSLDYLERIDELLK